MHAAYVHSQSSSNYAKLRSLEKGLVWTLSNVCINNVNISPLFFQQLSRRISSSHALPRATG